MSTSGNEHMHGDVYATRGGEPTSYTSIRRSFIVEILYLCLVNFVLHSATDLVIDRIKVWTIRLFGLSLAQVRL